jgi:hypothetical protein
MINSTLYVPTTSIIKLLSALPVSHGGLTPLAIGLFHPYEKVRISVADLLERINSHPVGPSSFLIVGWTFIHRFTESVSEDGF